MTEENIAALEEHIAALPAEVECLVHTFASFEPRGSGLPHAGNVARSLLRALRKRALGIVEARQKEGGGSE